MLNNHAILVDFLWYGVACVRCAHDVISTAERSREKDTESVLYATATADKDIVASVQTPHEPDVL